MSTQSMPPNVVRGREIYETQIRPHLEATHHGAFVVINTQTGEYEMDTDQLAATDRALQRFGRGEDLYKVRVGYRGVVRLGGGRLV